MTDIKLTLKRSGYHGGWYIVGKVCNSDRECISTSFEPFKCIVLFYIRDLQLDCQIAIENVLEGMYFSFPC